MKEWERRHNIWVANQKAVEQLIALKDDEIARLRNTRGETQKNEADPPIPTSGDSLGAATATPNGTPTF